MLPLHIAVLTLFPEMFPGPLGAGLLAKAAFKHLWRLHVTNVRLFGRGTHKTVDDTPYGGGCGMIMRPDVVHDALLFTLQDKAFCCPRLLYPSPRGPQLTQNTLQLWAQERRPLVILCGRYEGVDQRVLDHWSFEDISCGDYVLMGGELPAMVMIEGTVRLLPGVVHDPHSVMEESFSEGLLEHPLYTRPQLWHERSVPSVLLSGHHQNIYKWQEHQRHTTTQERRPDLWKNHQNRDTKEDRILNIPS